MRDITHGADCTNPHPKTITPPPRPPAVNYIIFPPPPPPLEQTFPAELMDVLLSPDSDHDHSVGQTMIDKQYTEIGNSLLKLDYDFSSRIAQQLLEAGFFRNVSKLRRNATELTTQDFHQFLENVSLIADKTPRPKT